MKSTRTAVVALLLCASVFAAAGCGSTASSVVSPGLDNAPPASPTSVQVSHDGQINVDDLTWVQSVSPGVTSYEIHRYASMPSGSSAGEQVITVDASESSLRLPLVSSDRTEYYRVRAISSTQVASAFSGAAQADRVGYQGGDLGRDRDGGNRGGDSIE